MPNLPCGHLNNWMTLSGCGFCRFHQIYDDYRKEEEAAKEVAEEGKIRFTYEYAAYDEFIRF